MKIGGHKDDFHFLPIISVSGTDHFPRILHIAGVYPGITKQELFSCPTPRPTRPEQFTFEFPTPHSAKSGIIAIPGSNLMTNCREPVAVVSTCKALEIEASEDLEVVVIVDRGETSFTSSDHFYLALNRSELDHDSPLRILWLDKSEISQYEIVGKVVLCLLPCNPNEDLTSSFMEEDF